MTNLSKLVKTFVSIRKETTILIQILDVCLLKLKFCKFWWRREKIYFKVFLFLQFCDIIWV